MNRTPTDLKIDIAETEKHAMSRDEAGAILEALEGLRTGDLAPLGSYLVAGYPLHPVVRAELVKAINKSRDHRCYHLTLVRNGRGGRDIAHMEETFLRKLQVTEYFEERLKSVRNRKTALDEARAKFRLEKTAIEEALAEVKRWRAANKRVLRQRERLIPRSRTPSKSASKDI